MMSAFTLLTLLLAATAGFASAQNCYYPNGDIAPDSSPCGTGDFKACCPLNWECLSNGLCYLPNEPYWGRYSCKDPEWGSGCPDYCTYNGTAYGNEAIGKCDDGSWCCDMDRQHGDCCEMSDAEVFYVPRGNVVATVTETPHPTSEDSTTSGTATPSSSSSTTSSSTLFASLEPPRPFSTTITTQEATTDSQGAATTVVIISTAPYTLPPPSDSSPSSQPDDHKPNNIPLIAGLAAGIPGILASAALLTFLLHRRRKTQKQHHPSPSDSKRDLPYMYENATPTGQPPELDSFPKAGHSSIASELSASTPSYQSPALSSVQSPFPPSFRGHGNLQQVREEEKSDPEEPFELAGAENEITPEKTKGRASSYPGQTVYGGGQQEQQRASTGAGGGYVAYRPAGEGGGGDSVAEEVPTKTTKTPPPPTTTTDVQGEESAPSSPSSPQMDHGRLGGGGLRIVNP